MREKFITLNKLPAEVENLAIIPDKPDTLARIDTGPTEVASLDAHGDDLQEIQNLKIYVCFRNSLTARVV